MSSAQKHSIQKKEKLRGKQNPEKTSVFQLSMRQTLPSRIRSIPFFFICFTKSHIRAHYNSGCKDKDLLAYFEHVSIK